MLALTMVQLNMARRLVPNSAMVSTLRSCLIRHTCSDFTLTLRVRTLSLSFACSFANKSLPTVCFFGAKKLGISLNDTQSFHTYTLSLLRADAPPTNLQSKLDPKLQRPKIKHQGNKTWHSMKLRSRKDEATSAQKTTHDQSENLDSEEDVKRLAQKVIKNASQSDVMVQSVPGHRVEQLIVDLHGCGFQPSQILSLLSSHPAYVQSHRSFVPTIDQLLTHGLNLSQVMDILYSFQPIIKVSSTQISEVIDVLRDGLFSEKFIPQVLAGNPSILLVPKANISRRVTELRQLFTTADVLTLAVNCPEVLTEPWTDIQEKFDYVFHEMKITQKQMVYAFLFRHSLMHIKTRHAFLVRAGLFDMSKRREGEKSPNASLDKIINTTDEVFCHKFGGFAVEEYHAFSQLYAKERHQSQDSLSDEEEV